MEDRNSNSMNKGEESKMSMTMEYVNSMESKEHNNNNISTLICWSQIEESSKGIIFQVLKSSCTYI